MIEVNNLSKTFKVPVKEPGLIASIKSLFAKKYTEKNALQNINLKIDNGEIIGLLGANGAGKTTLVKILAGIIHPSSGQASVLGYTPWERPNEYRKQMSVIMGQKAQLWWDLPALDGFLLLKEIYQIPDQQYQDTINFLAEELNIKDQLKVQVRRLSLGERMKVELMAALLHNPKVIFLDEPTIGLDLTAQKAVRNFIKTYRKDHKPIMVLTSHYMTDIEELCQRVVVLKQGEIVYDGGIDKISGSKKKIKFIKLKLENDINHFTFPEELAEIVVQDGVLFLKTTQDKILKAAKFLIDNYHIHDFSIEDQPISDLIENIMLGRV